MRAHLRSRPALRSDRRAVTALEYGLIAALIAGVIITAVAALGTSIRGFFSLASALMGYAPGFIGQ